MVRAFQAAGVQTWADVAAFPRAQWLVYPGIGNGGFHWIQQELRRRAGEVKYTELGTHVSVRSNRVQALSPVVARAGVYFIQCGPFVKIGLARNVRKRCRSLQQTIPFQLDLIGVVAPADGQTLRALEQAYHRRFRSVRQCGEWFRLEGALDVFCLAMARGEAPT